MKRSPLRRKTPLKARKGLARGGGLARKPIKRKRRRGDNKKLRDAYRDERGACENCGTVHWLEVHHLLKRGRVDDRRNFLVLCGGRCHLLAEGHTIRGPSGDPLPILELKHCLWLKRRSDPQWYDEEWLREHRKPWSLPEPEEPSDLCLSFRKVPR